MAGNQNIIGIEATGDITARDISVANTSQVIYKNYNLPAPQEPTPKNFSFKVDKPIQTFTGREAFLVDLHKVVKEGQITVLTQAPFSVVAATGGIGKTETVRMYIQLHTHEYDHVIWIDAEKKSSAKNQFIELATRLKISTDFDGKPKEFDTILTQIFEKLLQNAKVVLLVFDNAEAFDDDKDLNLSGIRSLRPQNLSPFFVEPTIIVTSRNQNWHLQKVIQLDLWTEAEVVVFVIQRLGLEEKAKNTELALQLGNHFGRLPIALQAAVAVIRQQIKRRKKYGIQNLIDEYQNGSRKVLAQKPLDANMRPTHMGFTMLVLWNISLEKIVKFPDGALAIKILCFMAHLSPTRIPQDFLYALFQKDFPQESIENALEILEDYSLIASLGSADSDSHSFTIHRMIKDSTVENLRFNEERKSHSIFNETTFLNETDVLLKLSAESVNYIKTLDTRKLSHGGEIVDNLVCITNHVSKILDLKEFRDLTAEVAKVLRSTNNFAKSIELYENVLKATPASEVEIEISKILGDSDTKGLEDFDKSQQKYNLALAYKDAGFEQKSIELLKEVLENQTFFLGPHYRFTLGTKGAIATLLHSIGKYDEAAAKFSEVLEDFRNIQDTESESFLNTKHNYASLLKSQGKTEEALKLFTQVLEEREKNPDLNSETIISTKGNIATVLQEQGKLEEAAAMMLQTISDSTSVFGPFHLYTFTFKQNYAILLGKQGKHKEAAQHYLELLEIQETELGSEHPVTLRTKSKLAVLYTENEEPDKALPLLDVEVSEKVFGPEHPQTMVVANNLANVMTKQRKFVEALALHNKNLKLRIQVLGPNHPHTLDTMYSIGYMHCNLKEVDKAAEVLQDVLLRREEVLGKNHPSTIMTLKLLTISRNFLDYQNNLIVKFVTLTSVDAEIGRCLLEASNWNMEAALDIFFKSNSNFNPKLLNEVLKDQTRVFGPHHEVTLETKCSIATALHSMGKYDEAAAKFSEVLEDFRNIQDTHSVSFLRTKHNYADLLFGQGKTEEALLLFTEVLAEDEKNPDVNSERIIKTKGNIANVLRAQGKFEEASAMMLQNIEDATRVFGPFHLDTFTFKQNYARLLRDQEKHEEAVQQFLELLETQETELGSEHPDTLDTKHNLAVLYIKTEEPDQALPLLDVGIRERVFGPEHPETMGVANNLAVVMIKQGKFGEAMALFNKTLKLRTQFLGPNHPDTLKTMTGIGGVHCSMKEFDKAVEVFQDVLPRQVEVLGKNHPKTMITLEVLTDCREILDERNDLIVKFMTLTSVDAEIGRSLLEASNWNIEAALDTFFNSNSTEDITGVEEQDEASISSRTTTDFQDRTLDVISGNTTKGN